MEYVGTALLSGLVGGAAAVAVTRAVESLGGLMGGVLATVPTTIVPAAVGIAYQLRGDALQRALYSNPPGMLANAGFLLIWKYLPPRLPRAWSFTRQLVCVTTTSILAWFAAVSCIVAADSGTQRETRHMLVIGLVSMFMLLGAGLAACWKPLEVKHVSKPVSWKVLLARASMAFTVTTLCVLLSKVSDLAAGFATAFPAIFTTTMLSLWLSQGSAVSSGASGPMILGSTSVPTFVFFFVALVLAGLHQLLAAVLAWLLAVVCISLPAAFYIRWRRKVAVIVYTPKEEADSTDAASVTPAVDMRSVHEQEEKGGAAAMVASALAPYFAPAAAGRSGNAHATRLIGSSKSGSGSGSGSGGGGGGGGFANSVEAATADMVDVPLDSKA